MCYEYICLSGAGYVWTVIGDDSSWANGSWKMEGKGTQLVFKNLKILVFKKQEIEIIIKEHFVNLCK